MSTSALLRGRLPQLIQLAVALFQRRDLSLHGTGSDHYEKVWPGSGHLLIGYYNLGTVPPKVGRIQLIYHFVFRKPYTGLGGNELVIDLQAVREGARPVFTSEQIDESMSGFIER